MGGQDLAGSWREAPWLLIPTKPHTHRASGLRQTSPLRKSGRRLYDGSKASLSLEGPADSVRPRRQSQHSVALSGCEPLRPVQTGNGPRLGSLKHVDISGQDGQRAVP